jgi:hypothetical protein
MNEIIKSYYQWSLEETENNFDGEEFHILSYDYNSFCAPEAEDANFTDNELEIVQDYFQRNGRLPVIGMLSSSNTEGEYPWNFDDGKAVGGYRSESLAIDQGSENLQTCHRYLLGDNVDSMINCLVGLLFKDCKVGEVDVCALFGWIYVADLQNGESYFGSNATIFPPNFEDGSGKTLDQICEEKDDYKQEYPRYLDLTGLNSYKNSMQKDAEKMQHRQDVAEDGAAGRFLFSEEKASFKSDSKSAVDIKVSHIIRSALLKIYEPNGEEKPDAKSIMINFYVNYPIFGFDAFVQVVHGVVNVAYPLCGNPAELLRTDEFPEISDLIIESWEPKVSVTWNHSRCSIESLVFFISQLMIRVFSLKNGDFDIDFDLEKI